MIEQLDLLAPYQAHSPTSVKAAEQIGPSLNTLRERVYRCILSRGPITDEGISAATGLAANTARPRRIELSKAGRIIPAGTLPTASGRSAVAWVVAR
jgi:hypothetical protein